MYDGNLLDILSYPVSHENLKGTLGLIQASNRLKKIDFLVTTGITNHSPAEDSHFCYSGIGTKLRPLECDTETLSE